MIDLFHSRQFHLIERVVVRRMWNNHNHGNGQWFVKSVLIKCLALKRNNQSWLIELNGLLWL